MCGTLSGRLRRVCRRDAGLERGQWGTTICRSATLQTHVEEGVTLTFTRMTGAAESIERRLWRMPLKPPSGGWSYCPRWTQAAAAAAWKSYLRVSLCPMQRNLAVSGTAVQTEGLALSHTRTRTRTHRVLPLAVQRMQALNVNSSSSNPPPHPQMSHPTRPTPCGSKLCSNQRTACSIHLYHLRMTFP